MFLEGSLWRVDCAECGVVVEAVWWADAGSRFTRRFEEFVGWLAQRCDKTTIQAEMPKGRFTPPQPDWSHLARTRRILKEGGDLCLMAIGDSIVNDTMRSAWVAKLGEAYPKADIRA